MAEATRMDEDRGDRHASELPAGLRQDWPVPWQPVWGTEDGLGSRLTAALANGALGLAARLPSAALDLVIGGLARAAKLVDRRHAKSARDFLRQALGELPPRELEARVLQAYRHLFRVSIDFTRFNLRVPAERTAEHFDVQWTDESRRVRDAPQGCVVLTAHLGSWEAAFSVLPWIGFDPAYGIAKPPRNRPLSITLQRDRERRGVRLLPRRGAMNAARKVIAAGGTIAMVLDQRARKRPLLAPFFGRPARCDRSAAVLLRRLKVPVVTGACYMAEEPLRYRVVFDEVLWPEELAEEGLVEIATRINRSFERLIRAHPEQYFWLHDRFKDTPAAMPADRDEEGDGEGIGEVVLEPPALEKEATSS